jgi:hypothetical protein
MPNSQSPRVPSKVAVFSVLAAPLSWVVIYASGRMSAASFSEAAANRMFLLLAIAGLLTLAGLVLGILGVRMKAANRLLAILGLVLNALTAAFLLILGVIWIGLSL